MQDRDDDGRNPATYRVWPEAAKRAGIGRTTAYAEARSGRFLGVRVIRVRGRYLVPKAALEAVLDGREPPE